MKRTLHIFGFILFSFLFLSSYSVLAQERPDIEAIEIVPYSNFYYANEAAWWRNFLDENPTSERAWLNYYKALRYLNYTEHSRSISKQNQAGLDKIVSDMRDAIPTSFAYEYAAYLNGNKTVNSFSHLTEAYRKKPSAVEFWDDMLCKAVIEGDKKSVVEFAQKLENIGVYTSSEILYSRNALNSVEENAILITNGNKDTYPILILQYLHGLRNDVRVLCLDWLENETYSGTVRGWLGVVKPGTKLNLSKILSTKSDNTIYLSLTIPPDELTVYSDNLYCTGLAMKYSKSALDNIPVLVSNWENRFDKSSIIGNGEITKNYLIPFLLLEEYYTSKGKKNALLDNKLTELKKEFGLQKVLSKQND